MKLITETVHDVQYVTEARDDGNKSIFIEGIYMQSEKPNRNGRVYRRPVLENEVNRYQSLITEKRALGELGHPPNPQINLDKVSHLITSLRFEGNDVVGRAKLLDTPMGKIAKNFIEEGVRLGVSSRGLGSLKEGKNGVMEVQSDFHLATVDIVADPSAPDAFVQGIYESAEWLYVEGKGYVMADARKNLDEAIKQTKYDKALREKKLLEAFNSFFKAIK
jgi:hypothetical protein